MGTIDRLGSGIRKLFPSKECSAYDPFPDDRSSISSDVFREAPIDLADTEAVTRRDKLRTALFEAAFGTTDERVRYGSKCFPFTELPPDAVAAMPPALQASYIRELAYASDPRSGRIVRPYLPPGVIETL